jgi:hypothetical protein
MHNEPSKKPGNPRQIPWNKGKIDRLEAPLRTKDVWSIRTKLQVERRTEIWLCSIWPSIASYAAAMW